MNDDPWTAREARALLAMLTMQDNEIQRDAETAARFRGIVGPLELEPGLREALDRLYERYGAMLRAMADETDPNDVEQ